MTVERKFGPLLIARQGVESPHHLVWPYCAEGRLLKFLYQNFGRICTPEEIYQACKIKNIPVWCTRLVKTIKVAKFSLYSLKGSGGVMLSRDNLESGPPPTLKEIGISVFCQEIGGRKVIPGLSVLSLEVLKNQPVDIEALSAVMNRLEWVKPESRRPFLVPFISPLQRQLLACLAKGGLWSEDDLRQAIGMSFEGQKAISRLGKKLTSAGMEIAFFGGDGWRLRSKDLSIEPFFNQ